MKRLFYTAACLILLCTQSIVIGQAKEPIKTIEIQNNATSMVKHPTTGTPIIFTNKQIFGLDVNAIDIKWTINRSGLSTATELNPTEESTDYLPYNGTPYALIGRNLVNVVTGDVLVDGATEEVQSSMSYFILPNEELMLLELGVKGKVKLYGIDIFGSKLLWDVELREMSGMAQRMSYDEEASEREIQPQMTPHGHLLYQKAKDLMTIDMKEGKLLWKKELNPGYIQYHDDNNIMLIANKQKGISFSDMKKYGRILYCIDPISGESQWKKNPEYDGNIQSLIPYEDNILVIHDRGANIMDIQTGEGQWKSDYVLKRIQTAELEEDGIVFFTKKEKFLVNSTTGENKWKEPKRLEKVRTPWVVEPKGIDWYGGKLVRNEGKVIYTKGDESVSITSGFETQNEEDGLIFTSYPIYDDKQRVTSYSTYMLDAKNMKTAFLSIRPTKYPRKKQAFTSNQSIFFNCEQSFRLIQYENGKMSVVEDEYYKEPGAGMKKLGKSLLGVAYMAAGTAMAFDGIGKAMVSDDPNDGLKYHARMDAYSDAGDMTADALARKDKSSMTEDFAYFFTKNKEKELVLMKVQKSTGKEVDQFKFTDKTPVYKVDEENNLLYYSTDKTLQVFSLN